MNGNAGHVSPRSLDVDLVLLCFNFLALGLRDGATQAGEAFLHTPGPLDTWSPARDGRGLPRNGMVNGDRQESRRHVRRSAPSTRH